MASKSTDYDKSESPTFATKADTAAGDMEDAPPSYSAAQSAPLPVSVNIPYNNSSAAEGNQYCSLHFMPCFCSS